MGVTYSTWCRRCGVEAPEMGDFGFVGLPTLKGKRTRDGLLPFGRIFAGFAALRFVTSDLAAFKAFLDAHDGHPIVRSSDFGEEVFGSDGTDRKRPPRKLRPFRHRTGRLQDGFYELACSECGLAHRASASGALRAFEETSIKRGELSLFHSDVSSIDRGNFYKMSGPPYDDIASLAEFIDEHKGHSLRARIDRADHVPPPSRPRSNVEQWIPPSWEPEEYEGYLGTVSARLLPTLAVLRHHQPQRRVDACRTVGASGERGALGYVVSLLEDPSIEVRIAAIQAIGALKDSRGIRALGRVLLTQRGAAEKAGRAALASLGVSTKLAMEEVRDLRGPYTAPGSLLESVVAKPAVIERVLRDPRSRMGSGAEEALGESAHKAWARDLALVVAVHPSPSARAAAAEVLGCHKDRQSSAALVAMLSDYADWAAYRAAEALSPRKLASAVQPLLQLVGRRDSLAAREATKALAVIKDPGLVAPLIEMLGHELETARCAAAELLGTLGDSRAVGPLADRLSDERLSVRNAAALALGKIGGAEASVSLVGHLRRAHAEDRLGAVWALRQMGERALAPGLVAALRDVDRSVRRAAASALARLDRPRGNRALVAAARRGDLVVASEAWQVLLREGAPGTQAVLVEMACAEHDPDIIGAFFACGNPALARAVSTKAKILKLKRDSATIRWGERAVKR